MGANEELFCNNIINNTNSNKSEVGEQNFVLLRLVFVRISANNLSHL